MNLWEKYGDYIARVLKERARISVSDPDIPTNIIGDSQTSEADSQSSHSIFVSTRDTYKDVLNRLLKLNHEEM